VIPYNGETLSTILLANRDDIAKAYENAKQSQVSWEQLNPYNRAMVMENAAQLMVERADELIKILIAETGSTRIKSRRNHMKIAQTELFALVACIIPVESEEEAIQIANDTSYGLSSAVFSGSIEHGIRVAQRIHAGMVHVNDQTSIMNQISYLVVRKPRVMDVLAKIGDWANLPQPNGCLYKMNHGFSRFNHWPLKVRCCLIN
jgi:acyl-CoA reductase-like NAD-dependent aldehyde dehydrogenase